MAYHADPILLKEKEQAFEEGSVSAALWLGEYYYNSKDYTTALKYYKKIEFQHKHAYEAVNIINRILEENKGYETPSYDEEDWG